MPETSSRPGQEPPREGAGLRFPDPEALQREFGLRGCDIVVQDLPPRWVGALFVDENGGGIEIQLSPAESDSHAGALGMMHRALAEPAGKPWHRFGERRTWVYRVHWSATA
jgi:hypothetical protein